MPYGCDIDLYEGVDEALFQKIVARDEPAVMKNCSFGDCMSKWTLEYLDEKLGQEDVVIHPSLRFSDKNCETHKFHDYARMIRTPKAEYYLRSTSDGARAEQPASIEKDYPAIAKDLVPPKFIPYGKENSLYHSSALRVASKDVVVMTHYNLYDSVLCQIVGTNYVSLISPGDTHGLVRNGFKYPANLSDGCCGRYEYPELEYADLHCCDLEPGDCLFIPALWWLHIGPEYMESKTSSDHTIGFSIFWRNEKLARESFYAPKDIRGNKDPLPYDAAVRHIEKAMQHLNKIPKKYSDFYKEKFAHHLKEICPCEEYKDYKQR